MDTPSEYQGLGHATSTREQTDALLVRMTRARDSGQRRRFERLRNEIVSGNLRLVYSVAIRFQGRGIDLPDLVSEGALGLMHALDKFDPDRGCQLSTYAINWIRQTIRRAIQDKARAVRVPVHRLEGAAAIARPRAAFFARYGREPTADELGVGVKRSAKRLREDIEATAAQMLSLDVPLTDEGTGTWLDAMPGHDPGPEAALLAREREDAARAALSRLPEREAAVLRARYSDGAPTLADIGRVTPSCTGSPLTRERIRQIQNEGLRRLRARRGRLDELR